MPRLSAHARGRMAGEGAHPLGANPFAAPAGQVDWLKGYVQTCSPENRLLAERRMAKLHGRDRGGLRLRGQPLPGGRSLP